MIQLGVSGIHGTGAFAASDLAQGTRIGIYEGRRYTMRQAQRRDWDQHFERTALHLYRH